MHAQPAIVRARLFALTAGAALAVAAACSACSDATSPFVPGDAGPREDATGLDAAIRLDGAVVPDLGLRIDATVDMDSGPRDGTVVTRDVGPALPGESCETALEWSSPETELVTGNSSISVGREQLSCASMGPNADAPDVWWRFDLSSPKHVILHLGTLAWDGVLATRTGTCTRETEMCSDAPAIVEMPAVAGPIAVGADGFARGRGEYAIRAEISDPLELPARNARCESAAEISALPFTAVGHDYGGTDVEAAGCELASAVFHRFELSAAAPISLRVQPLAGQDVDVAILDACGGTALACANGEGRGIAELIGPLQLGTGAYIVAIGTRADRPSPGAFRVSLGATADCRSDVDCAMGERCTALLECGAPGSFTMTSTTTRAIPDGFGALEVPISMVGPERAPIRVRARVAIDHPFPEDLVIDLVAPGEPRVSVRLRERSSGGLDRVYGADRPAEGAASLDDFMIAPSGRGVWTLRIEDRAAGDRGSLLGFALDVE